MNDMLPILVMMAVMVLSIGSMILMLKLYFRSVAPHEALVISRSQGHAVSFTSALVLPFIQQAEVLNTAPVEVGVGLAGEDACRTADNLKVDLEVTFSVKVNRTEEDVLLVAQNLGCEKASDPAFIQDLFGRKFSEALRTVVRQFDYEALDRDLPKLREEVLLTIGRDLDGFVIEDLVIESCKVTPPEFYDENDPLDRKGLARIDEQADDKESQPAGQGEPAW